MLVGYIWGRRYTHMEVLSVSMLTIGVIVAAMADAQSKVSQQLDCSRAWGISESSQGGYHSADKADSARAQHQPQHQPPSPAS